jgi:predicted enzyme related to lactoylglutathione lyase
MFRDTKANSGFAVADLAEARRFYGDTLGIGIEILAEEHGVAMLKLAGGYDVLMYESGDMTPPSYTILNFEVDDVDAVADRLVESGIALERYEGFEQDEKGVARGPGPQIAWFKDPSGNVLSVLQQG